MPQLIRSRSFQPLVVSLVIVTAAFGPVSAASAGSTHPYYRSKPPVHDKPESAFGPCRTDFTSVHLPAYLADPGDLDQYTSLFDARAAAIIHAATTGVAGGNLCNPDGTNLLKLEQYDEDAPDVNLVNGEALASMAYRDFFPQSKRNLEDAVNAAIRDAGPGWAGTIGPGQDNLRELILEGKHEADYDMRQMFLIPLVYRYFERLGENEREKLITVLLARGRVHRINRPETFTSGRTPDDWARAGYVTPLAAGHKDIYETENHILMILTTRYLTNQLLYQRDPKPEYDNRRNGGDGAPATADVILSLMRNILRGDFSEYNAKPYQTQTRLALLNLATFSYDYEVRLAARMVLDYVSARYAVTSNDLRRMLPFRRRNEPPNRSILGEWGGAPECPGAHLAECEPGKGPVCPPEPGPAPYPGIMDVGLLDWQLGGDPLSRNFALQAGNTRTYAVPFTRCGLPNKDDKCRRCQVRPWPWAIADGGVEISVEALSDYRLPPSIHDLIVNDHHRRFYQKLHRLIRPEETGGMRNCDSWEFNSGSPSYLITAGGTPCDYAIDPRFAGFTMEAEGNRSQKGFAVTTSFMPTGSSAGSPIHDASGLIQFSNASEDRGGVANYGVGPDIAFGHAMYLPPWVTYVTGPLPEQGWVFVNKSHGPDNPGFYLAIFHDHGFGLLEAYDTWVDPKATGAARDRLAFDQFKDRIPKANPGFHLSNNAEMVYRTQKGHAIRLVIWNNGERLDVENGAQVLEVAYDRSDRNMTLGDAGNTNNMVLNGTVINSSKEAVVEISNPGLDTKIVLDLSDRWTPRRTAEDGQVEHGGSNHEVWVDFDWIHQTEGDFYRPFNKFSSAVEGVAPGGTVKIMPGSIREAAPVRIAKRMRIVAPIGGVRIGRK